MIVKLIILAAYQLVDSRNKFNAISQMKIQNQTTLNILQKEFLDFLVIRDTALQRLKFYVNYGIMSSIIKQLFKSTLEISVIITSA